VGAPPDPPAPVLDAALRLLAVRPRSVAELRDRLERKGFATPEIDTCLARLTEGRLLDDAAFARAWVRDRILLAPRGRRLLLQELRRKGVDGSTGEAAVDEVLREEDVSELLLARRAGAAWARRQSRDTAAALLLEGRSSRREKARRRLTGFLLRRGFVGEALQEGIRAACEEARERLSR